MAEIPSWDSRAEGAVLGHLYYTSPKFLQLEPNNSIHLVRDSLMQAFMVREITGYQILKDLEN